MSEPSLFQGCHVDGDVEPESGVVAPVLRERLAEELGRVTRLAMSGGHDLAGNGPRAEPSPGDEDYEPGSLPVHDVDA